MSTGDSDRARREWEQTLEYLSGTLPLDVAETIRPLGRPCEDASAAKGDVARASAASAFAGRIELMETLGEGGMGVVRLGTQTALGRPVAVKALKRGVQGSKAATALLQEAWVTGSLEHPNIVPLYDLGLDSDGRPVILMKRIVGRPWSDLVDDASTVRDRFDADDLLEWNLGVFRQVCHAVHFAHSRGILHLDLKPSNVMVGDFGEVYVVDWGIAVSLAPDPRGRFPLAADVTWVQGTPGYLAPEMVAGEGDAFSERTDVYLLGSVLYRLLTGHPPFRGETPLAVLYAAVTTRPELPADLPAELADICRQAMASEPADRFESADLLGRAVMGFLRHRESHRLALEAAAVAERLEALVGDPASRDHKDFAGQVASLYPVARFGFQMALQSWEGNAFARAGLDRLLWGAAEYEIALGDPSTAAAFIGEASEVPAELQARVDAALRARDERLPLRELRRVAGLWRRFAPTLLVVVAALVPAVLLPSWRSELLAAVGSAFLVNAMVVLRDHGAP